MKKIIVFAMLLITATVSFSQQNKPTPGLSKQDYLLKSKHQKTTAWILLGGGATCLLTGIIIPKGEVVHEGFWSTYKNTGTKNGLGLTGILAMTASIPFFAASSKNKKRAASVSFKNETVPQIQKTGFSFYCIPSLTLKINL